MSLAGVQTLFMHRDSSVDSWQCASWLQRGQSASVVQVTEQENPTSCENKHWSCELHGMSGSAGPQSWPNPAGLGTQGVGFASVLH